MLINNFRAEGIPPIISDGHAVTFRCVFKDEIWTLNISIPATQDVYTTLVHLINDNSLDIDRILNLLVENNIASINKTLIFND